MLILSISIYLNQSGAIIKPETTLVVLTKVFIYNVMGCIYVRICWIKNSSAGFLPYFLARWIFAAFPKYMVLE